MHSPRPCMLHGSTLPCGIPSSEINRASDQRFDGPAEDCLVELDARVWLLVGEGLEAIEKQPGRIDHIDGGSYLRFLAAGGLGGRALEPCCLRDQGLGAPIEQLAGGRNRLTQSRPRGRSMVQTDAGETSIHPVDR